MLFSSRLRLTLLAFLAFPFVALAATPITGVVTNRTTGKPAAGDDVVLIRLAQGMQESTRTKTDAHGKFTLDVPDDGLHLVRVTHEKAAYFRPAPPGTQSVEIDVFDVAAKVKGVTVEADVMRLQTDAANNTLRVVDHFFIKNDSKPQLTQFSSQPFDFYLPEGAVVDGSAAMAPGGMPVQAAPIPLADKGHYTFVFPIRPGETQFQISYHLPYSGKLDFVPRMASPTGTIALMMPKSMTFAPVAGNPYQSVSDEVNAQTYVARNVTPKDALGFTISGTGQLPRDTQDQGSTPGAGAAGPAAGATATNSDGSIPATQNTMPGKGLDNPLDPEGTRDPWSKYKWWILSGIGFLLVAGAGVLLRKPGTATTAAAVPLAAPSAATHRQRLLDALKEELFALETERLQNTLSETEYAEQKTAIELVLRRALGRTAAAETRVG